jgi:hypothetical protein
MQHQNLGFDARLIDPTWSRERAMEKSIAGSKAEPSLSACGDQPGRDTTKGILFN